MNIIFTCIPYTASVPYMKNSGFTVAQIDEIILVGGSTSILAIQDALTALKVAPPAH